MQKSLWQKARQWIEWKEGAHFIAAFNKAYSRYVAWRDEGVAEVFERGWMEVPVTGQWLWFSKPGARDEIDKAIYNFPVQGPCAEIGKVAHLLVIRWLRERGAGCAPLSVHDSVWVDCRWPVERKDEVIEGVRPLMEDHWYIRALYEHFGRRVEFPVDFEVLGGYD